MPPYPVTKTEVTSDDAITVAAQQAVQTIIRKYSLEAVWPPSRNDHVRALSLRMAVEIAASFDKSIDDIDLASVSLAIKKIEETCSTFGLHKIKFRQAKSIVSLTQKVAQIQAIVSHTYWLGNAFYGNFGPAIRKFGLNITGAPMARAAGVWLAGQMIAELYFEPAKFKAKASSSHEYTPLFDSLSLDHCRELALLLDIDARVSWDLNTLKKEILSEINSIYHNKITALWSDIPEYKAILLCLCSELDIPGYQPSDSDELLEERIVQRVLADRVANMTPDQLKKFNDTIQASMRDDYWFSSVNSSLVAGGLVAGNLSGFGLYIAATSALSALGHGLGITFAFTTYTTLSSALSAVFGPVGIGSAAAVAAFNWTRARPRKALPFVLYLAAVRGQIAAASKPLSLVDRFRNLAHKIYLKLVLDRI